MLRCQQPRKADEFREKLFDTAALGGFAAADLPLAVLCHLDNPPFAGDGIDQPHRMVLGQGDELLLECREALRLDLHQQIVAHDVDDVTIDGNLEPVARLRVPRLQIGVERPFVPRTDDGGRAAFG